MIKNDRISKYFELKNYNLKNKYNIIYNKKFAMYMLKTNGWLLNKETIRAQMQNNMYMFLTKFRNISEAVKNDIVFHSYKIKKRWKENKYNEYIKYVSMLLKYFNPDLYKQLEQQWYFIELKMVIQRLYDRPTYNYYTWIGYGDFSPNYDLVSDYYYINELKKDVTERDLFFDLINDFNNNIRWISDWMSKLLWKEDVAEMSNLSFINDFFSSNDNYATEQEIWKILMKMVREEKELTEIYNNYLKEIEEYKSDKFKKYKYKYNFLYKLIRIYEKAKQKIFSSNEEISSINFIKIKEGNDFYKVNNDFYKFYYITPAEKETEWKNSWIKNTTFVKQLEEKLDGLNVERILNNSAKAFNNYEYNNFFTKYSGVSAEWQQNIRMEWLYHYNIVLAVKSKDIKYFKQLEDTLKTLSFSNYFIYTTKADISLFYPYYRDKGLWITVQGQYLFNNNYVKNSSLDTFYNFTPKNIKYEKGTLLGVNIETQEPVFLNPSDNKIVSNRNVCILWSSGSWKTVTAKTLIKRWMLSNKFIIIDHLRSYIDLVKDLKGKCITFDDDFIVNPLIIKANEQNDKEYDFSTHMDWVLSLFKQAIKINEQEERVFKLIIDYVYKKLWPEIWYKIKLDHIINVSKKYMKHYQDKKDFENYNVIKWFIIWLEWIKGSKLWTFLNSDKDFDIQNMIRENQIVLFDFSIIKSSWNDLLLSVFSFLVFQNISSYFYNSKEEREEIVKNIIEKGETTMEEYKNKVWWSYWRQNIYLVAEEIHQYLGDKNEVSNRILFDMVKQIRNTSGGLISISQQIGDFLSNRTWEAIFDNSSSYLILTNDLSLNDAEIIKKRILNNEDSDANIDTSDLNYLVAWKNAGQWYWLLIHWKLPVTKFYTMADKSVLW